MPSMLPDSWQSVLGEELDKPYFQQLDEFVEAERKEHRIFPPREEVFAALEATPFDRVKVLVLGQDPYHGEGQGHGLCFSVRPGVRTPPDIVAASVSLDNDVLDRVNDLPIYRTVQVELVLSVFSRHTQDAATPLVIEIDQDEHLSIVSADGSLEHVRTDEDQWT